jgi:hypothetical protein
MRYHGELIGLVNLVGDGCQFLLDKVGDGGLELGAFFRETGYFGVIEAGGKGAFK